VGAQGVGRLVVVGRAGDIDAGALAAVGLFGLFNVPFVYWSVNLWRTLHPKTSVVPTLPVSMGVPLWFSTVAFLGLFTLLFAMRTRLERRRVELDSLHLALDE
jgi:heme exporter protein C